MSVICPLLLHVKLEADLALASFWSKYVPTVVFPKVKFDAARPFVRTTDKVRNINRYVIGFFMPRANSLYKNGKFSMRLHIQTNHV
jgi:hypothetical protein